MRVRDIMTTEVASCRESDDLATVARLMDRFDCGCVPVTREDGRLLGVVTDRDICLVAARIGKPLAELNVRDGMTRPVRTCSPDASPREAEYVMREAGVRRLPVVDDAGNLVGLLSLTDLAREAAHERRLRHHAVGGLEVAETLAAVCPPRG